MEFLPLILGVLAGLLTSYTDLKTGFIYDTHIFPSLTLLGKVLGWEDTEEEVPLPKWVEKIVIPAAEIGVLYYAYKGIVSNDLMLAVSGVLGLLLGFILGLFLYYIGAWASGDAVVLAGLSALLPMAPNTAKIVPPYALHLPLYPITILFNSILLVFPFILVYSILVLITKGEWKELQNVLLKNVRGSVELALWLTVAIVVQIVMGGIPGVLMSLLLILAFVKFRIVGDALGVVSLGYLAYVEPSTFYTVFAKLLLLSYLLKVMISVVKLMRLRVLTEEVTVEELREWDILGEVIHEKNGEIVRDRSDLFERLGEFLKSWRVSLLRSSYGRIIASPTAEGLTKEQIEELKRLVDEGKLENKFLRKKAMPFAPAIFLGFLVSYFFGDLFWWLVIKVAGL